MSVARPIFTPPAERRSVLDRAHVGDIEGALGTVGSFDTGPRRTFGRRLATLLAIMGPGLVVMVADNDAGGLAVYSQAGQGYGPSLLWVLLLLAPVLFINQEMVARLGAVTGAGHARLIVERFGRRKTGVNETGSRSRSLLIAARHALDDPATAEHLRRRRPASSAS